MSWPQVALLLLAVYLSAVQGQSMFYPTNAIVSVDKEGCSMCVTIYTSICSGYCQTREPVYKNARLSIYQHVCTYKEMRYVTIILPYCQPGTNPFFTYPVAVSCERNLCNTDYTDCTVKALDQGSAHTASYPDNLLHGKRVTMSTGTDKLGIGIFMHHNLYREF